MYFAASSSPTSAAMSSWAQHTHGPLPRPPRPRPQLRAHGPKVVGKPGRLRQTRWIASRSLPSSTSDPCAAANEAGRESFVFIVRLSAPPRGRAYRYGASFIGRPKHSSSALIASGCSRLIFSLPSGGVTIQQVSSISASCFTRSCVITPRCCEPSVSWQLGLSGFSIVAVAFMVLFRFGQVAELGSWTT